MARIKAELWDDNICGGVYGVEEELSQSLNRTHGKEKVCAKLSKAPHECQVRQVK